MKYLSSFCFASEFWSNTKNMSCISSEKFSVSSITHSRLTEKNKDICIHRYRWYWYTAVDTHTYCIVYIIYFSAESLKGPDTMQ